MKVLVSEVHVDKAAPAGELWLRLVGALSEYTDFSKVGTADIKKMLVDLSQCSNVNSTGIRNWLLFQRNFDTAPEIVFIEARPLVAQQIRMVPEFAGKQGRVESFFAPFYCEKCEVEKEVLTEPANFSEIIANGPTCPDCAAPMEFDGVEETFPDS